MSPELCEERSYDNKVDVWAVGVITFVLLTGSAPFSGRSKQEIYSQIINSEPAYSKMKKVSQSAKEFIQACLKKSSDERPTMAELLDMNWFKLQRQETLTTDQQLNISANVAAFRKTTAFQSGVCSIIANLQTKAEDLKEVREMFLKFDANNDGFLTLEELRSGYSDIAQILNVEEPDVEEMLRGADLDGDGKIDYTEFIAAAFQKDLLLSGENLQRAFRMFDADGDGTISKEELKQVFGGGHVN